jgi:hypothetical protein
MRSMVEGALEPRKMHEELKGVPRAMQKGPALPPPARFTRHLPRKAGEEPLSGSLE